MIIIVVVKDVLLNMVIKKLDIVCVVIVWICKKIRRKNGMSICFDDNVVVLINKEGLFIGIWIFGFIVRELRDNNFIKIVLLVFEVL